MTYTFNHPKYAERFKLPELYNWGSKIAHAVELAIQSSGPVFIYTYFNSAGIIPLAFALEMNGFKRYKQHDTPLLEYTNTSHDNKGNSIYRGDYIIYTGNKSLSAYATYYINKRKQRVGHRIRFGHFCSASKHIKLIRLVYNHNYFAKYKVHKKLKSPLKIIFHKNHLALC